MPPPLAGTISLGIYDEGERIVRVLHREDTISDFAAGSDALETSWDGLDEKGKPSPAGRYHARGFLVGDLKVDGVAYFFNDWVTSDTSPHLSHISRIDVQKNLLKLTATLADGKTADFLCDSATQGLQPVDATALPATPQLNNLAPSSPEVIALAAGKNGTWWAILSAPNEPDRREVAQISGGVADSAANKLRELVIAPNDPSPVGIAASLAADQVFLLEESPALQRVRSLTLLAAKSTDENHAASDWKVDFAKAIVAHGKFFLKDGKPVLSPNDQSSAPEKISQTLRANPLDRDRRGEVQLATGFDERGSYLETVDGLPLRTVSDNAHLKRVLAVRHDQTSVDLFQDDGAVVEQFRISRLGQMLAFDCGEFELK